MDPMHEIARQAIEQTPPAIRVTPEQASVIAAHADELLALGPEIVQAFYDTARSLGAESLHAPKLWPEYHPGYYGAFVRDPDGNNVEAVFHGAPPQ